MTFDWYKIINRTEFEALGLVSREIQVVLSGVGSATILVVQSNLFSLVYDGVMLPVGLTENNLFVSEGYAVYQDANADVWLGVESAA